MIFTSIKQVKPNKINDVYVTSEYIDFAKYLIINELLSIHREHSPNYGDMVICLDDSTGGYWRKDVYPMYKYSRKQNKEDSEINYEEVFAEINILIDQLRNNVPWKVVNVPRAEADDLILILAKEYSKYEKILILSPDKDMIQAQTNENVQQWSTLTKKWITPDTKCNCMDEWINEHVCLGDSADDVPKIVDCTEFSESFIAHLEKHDIDIKTPHEFINSDLSTEERKRLLGAFNEYKTNRKGESTGIKNVYKDIRFGPAALKKKLKEFGSLDAWLDSHPLYRKHYDRNYKLVMTDGIPSGIWNEIILNHKEASSEYNSLEFERYLKANNLNMILVELPNHFKLNRKLTAEDFEW